MRQGRAFKRCSHCGARVADKRCPKCNGDSFSWAYTVDIAAKGDRRQQRMRSGFATKSSAVAAMVTLQASKEDGSYIEASRRTLGDYLASWIAGGAGGHIRATTLKNYDVAVRVHIIPSLGKIALQRLTRAEIKTMCHDLQVGGYREGRSTGKALSPKTVHSVALTLRKALADAVADGLLRSNPAEAVHRLPTDRKEMLTWSAAELRSFLGAMNDDPNYGLWRLAANTGMRRGELLGLRWREFDPTSGRVAVRQQLIRAGKVVAFGSPKTAAGRRSVSLDTGTVGALEAIRSAQKVNRLRFGAGYADHDLIFCRPDGSPHDPDTVTHQFELACSRAHVQRIRFHDLRHTHATLLLQANVHPKVIQERLGHSNIMVTMNTYSHVLPNMQDEAAAKIGALVD
jgi:integrase